VPKPAAFTWDAVRRLALTLDGTEESTSYGTPALKVKKKLYARLHQDGEHIVVRMPKAERARRIRSTPDAFSVTDHYRDHPYVLVRLATVGEGDLAEVLEAAWREVGE
jgi:hypothetical protein